MKNGYIPELTNRDTEGWMMPKALSAAEEMHQSLKKTVWDEKHC